VKDPNDVARAEAAPDKKARHPIRKLIQFSVTGDLAPSQAKRRPRSMTAGNLTELQTQIRNMRHDRKGRLYHQAAVDLYDGAVDVVVLGDETDRLINLLDVAQSAQRDLPFKLGQVRVTQRFPSRGGVHEAGRD